MKPPNVVESWIVNPKLSQSDFEGKQPPVDNGHARLDPARYHSEAFMALEWERLWTRVWLIAGVESDIPQPGDYLLYRIRHEEIICVRQTDGSVKAMYNVLPPSGQPGGVRRTRLACSASPAPFTRGSTTWMAASSASRIRTPSSPKWWPMGRA